MIKSEQQQTTAEERPLVTFALFAYNQEKYIREALEGAFSQTYSPLEIILSDDCSSDGTYRLMEELAEEYRGRHKIILNKMPENSGFANHINYVLKIAQGELVVMAAGDDISLPNRVETLVGLWLDKGKEPGVVYSNIDIIDKDSTTKICSCHLDFSKRSLQDFVVRPFALICSYSVSKSIIDKFPPLNAGLINEDFIFPLRSLLEARSVSYVDHSLVKYRVDRGVGHNADRSTAKNRKSLAVDFHREALMWEQILTDINYVGGLDAEAKVAATRLALAKVKHEICKASLIASVYLLVKMDCAIIEKIKFAFRVYFPNLHRVYKYVRAQLASSKKKASNVRVSLPHIYNRWFKIFKDV